MAFVERYPNITEEKDRGTTIKFGGVSGIHLVNNKKFKRHLWLLYESKEFYFDS